MLAFSWNMGQQAFVQFDFVAALFKSNTEYIFVFNRYRAVSWVYFNYIVCPLAFYSFLFTFFFSRLRLVPAAYVKYD